MRLEVVRRGGQVGRRRHLHRCGHRGWRHGCWRIHRHLARHGRWPTGLDVARRRRMERTHRPCHAPGQQGRRCGGAQPPHLTRPIIPTNGRKWQSKLPKVACALSGQALAREGATTQDEAVTPRHAHTRHDVKRPGVAARSGSVRHPGPAPAGVPRETPPRQAARPPARRRAACPSSPSRHPPAPAAVA